MISLLFLAMFQINSLHPPVLVPLNRVEKQGILQSSMADHGKVDRQIVDAHYPAGKPRASCGNKGEPATPSDGYRGHILNVEGGSIVYVWETPKCLTRGVK